MAPPQALFPDSVNTEKAGCQLKEMELEDVNSELHALRKLYGLLQITEDGLHTSSVNLDGRSRLLLKNLLDCATERVFETHSKIIATQSGVFNKPFSTQLEQPKATPKLQPPASPDILNASPIVIQKSSTDWNLHTVTSLKDDSSSIRPTHEGIVLVQSKPNISGTKPETRKKRCRVCEQSSMRQLNSAREKKTFKEKTQCSNNGGKDQDQRHANRLSHVHKVSEHVKGLELKKKAIESLNSTEKARQKRIHEIQRNTSTVRSLASSSGTLVSGVIKPGGEHNHQACDIDKKPEDVDYISTEVAKVIKQIETHLAAVQLPAEVVDSLKEKNALHQGLCMKANSIPIADTVGIELPNQVASQKEWKTRDTNDMLSQLASQTDGKSKRTTSPDNVPNQASKPNNAQHELLKQKPSQVPGQNVKAIVKKLESLSRLTSQNDQLSSQTHNYVHGLRASPREDELVKGPPLHVKMPSQIDKENRDHNPTAQKETRRKVGMSRDFVAHSRKSLAVNPSHKLSRTQTGESTWRENNLPHQLILRPTLVDHKSSQIINEDCREDRKRSGVHKSIHEGSRNKILPRLQSSGESSSSSGASSSWTTQQSSISSSESEGYPRPQRTATSRRLARMASDGSSVQYSSSHGTGSQYWDVGSPPPSRTGHVKSYGLDSGVNSGKRIGRLRRLKNKLGLIFHHHHHHYHHHHGKDNDYGNNADLGHATSLSLWKHMGKIFHHRNNDKVYADQAVDKTRKSLVNRVSRGNQRGHFGALVEGLMRHTRQSKKSKPSNGGIRRLEKSQHGYNRKAVKKLHWWQMIGRHHRGVKLPSVKLGFVSKKVKNVN